MPQVHGLFEAFPFADDISLKSHANILRVEMVIESEDAPNK